MVPRLLAADADLGMVGRVQVDDAGLDRGPDAAGRRGEGSAPTWPRANVSLLVLDPLTSVMDGRIDAHRDREVRSALEPLGQLAEHAGAAVLGLVHLGKAIGADPVNLILGSRAFSAVARVALVAARDPDDERVQRAVGGEVQPRPHRRARPDVPRSTAPRSPPTRAWQAPGCSCGPARPTAASATSWPTNGDERTERDEAADWLTGYLTDNGGEARAADVFRAAKADHIAERTLKRCSHPCGRDLRAPRIRPGRRMGARSIRATFGPFVPGLRPWHEWPRCWPG